MRHSLFLTATVLMLFVAHFTIPFVSGADGIWTGWRGPHRDGWVGHFEPPQTWPEQLKKRWQVEVGTGYGSPLVADGRVYLHTRQDEEEVVWCLDLKRGEIQWRKSQPVPFQIGSGGERHGKGPKASPALADGRLFTMSITGVLSAWDTDTGKRLWHRDFRSGFPSGHPYWGASASPLVDGDRVIVHFGTDEAGALMALDVETGKVIWSQGKDGASYSSPLLAEIDGVKQVLDWNHRALVGVENQTGRLLWEFPFPHEGTNQNMPTPVFHEGIVILGGENRGISGLKPQLKNGRWSAPELWHQKDVALDMSSAVINGDRLYGFSHYRKGALFCLDPQTGEILWQGPGRSGENVMFLSFPGHVAALMNDGELKIIKANSQQFEPVATYRVSEDSTWAPPVFLKKGVLIKDRKTLAFWSW